MNRRAAPRLLGILLPILLWWGAAAVTGVGVALPTPPVVALAILREIVAPGFAVAVGATVLRGVGAILLAVAVGVPLGMASARSPFVYLLARPTILAVRAIPFISVILVAVIWFSSGTVPVFVAVLMALPVVVDAARTAVEGVDPQLERMTLVHGFGPGARLRHLWFPGSIHGVLGGVRSGAGIAWKVTVAAEVLSSPAVGIGAQMGEARLYLETERVLAWTLVLIVVAGLSDLAVRVLQERSVRYRSRSGAAPARREPERERGEADALLGGMAPVRPAPPASLDIADVSFAWETQPLFDRLSLTFDRDRVTAVIGPSGVGKTTLLSLCAGAIVPDSGCVTARNDDGAEVVPRVAMVFQEPRLLPWRTAAENVALATPDHDRGAATQALLAVGLGAAAGAYPGELSGGMQQRVALARAMHRRPQVLLVDEPLSGVDPRHRSELTGELKRYIRRHDALTIVASHDMDLVTAIADRIVVLAGSPVRVADDLARPAAGWPADTADRVAQRVADARGGR